MKFGQFVSGNKITDSVKIEAEEYRNREFLKKGFLPLSMVPNE